MKHVKSLSSLALIAALGVSLAACGSSNDSVKAGETEAPVSAPSAEPVVKTTPTPTEDTKKSVRGNLNMAIGDTGTISDNATKKVHTKFTINSIAPIACTEQYASAPTNGNMVAVDITIETTPELAEDSYPKYTLSGYDFKFIAANGTTFNGNLATGATYGCIPNAESFPSDGLGPAEKVTAKLILDLPAPNGILVMKSGLSGFEYNF